jgi:flagellar biosynthetic protein FliP
VLVSLALFLTFFVMRPVFDLAWNTAIAPLERHEISETIAMERAATPFRQFMEAHVAEPDLRLFADMAGGKVAAQPGSGPALSTLMPAFLISELRRAFEIGFLLLMPFLVIDLVVAAVLVASGMMMLPPATVSLPLKLIFFVLVDGWALVAGSLVRSFGV